ncbi:lipopolysaccharide transport periplasmic protein LptA [Oceanicola sp. D3]|uniref:LptA/OstA family protein n=1 Tax=Oceanicola sp. D3 TaxID=2587163 RepID=UPI00111D272A|nr:LptA/OstA family protein [Oceanicola sp. D3]QDC11461.1 lipopolysaccharide transport periplasmic protein LptA [Oceanicola sp. D3]
MKRLFTAWLFVLFAGLSAPLHAQGANVAFGALKHDSSLPVEIAADQLQINQETGRAVFRGNVKVGQGEMRLTAAMVEVEYEGGESSTGKVKRLHATGGVTLVSGAEAAEAREAVYTIGTSQIVMTGDVLLTQGQNALSSQKMVVDLDKGTGVMEGRVRTVFRSDIEN